MRCVYGLLLMVCCVGLAGADDDRLSRVKLAALIEEHDVLVKQADLLERRLEAETRAGERLQKRLDEAAAAVRRLQEAIR